MSQMDQYNVAKKLTDQKLNALETHILSIRQRSQKLMKRHLDLVNRQSNLTQQNDGSNIKGSDKIHLNVGGTEMYALRETLTQIKGSRLEALFNGRWEDKLLYDEKGRVFLDLDASYFKIIMEHLHLMNSNCDSNNQENYSDWPKLPNRNQQMTLDMYIDFLGLKKVCKGTHNSQSIVNPNKSNNEGAKSYEDLLNVVKNEEHELDEVENNLDKMEKEIVEDEEFISFFTTTHPQLQVQRIREGSEHDTIDAISFTSSMISDLDSIVSSTSQQLHDNTKSPIVNLWIDGEIISTKRSTLCICKQSRLTDNLNDASWVNKHTVITKDRTEVVLIGHSKMFRLIINQLRLRSMMVEGKELPNIEMNEIELAEDIVSNLFPGKEESVLGEKKFDSQIIVSFPDNDQVMTWLEEVNRRSKPILLYRASSYGWETQSFHSHCDDHSNTLVIVKTGQGHTFGGYSDKKWLGLGWKSSSSSFLFSINCHVGLPPTKMKVKSGMEGKVLHAHPKYGPRFGDGVEVCIGANHDMKVGYTYLNNTFEIPSGASKTFLTGKTGYDKFIDFVEVEVFKV